MRLKSLITLVGVLLALAACRGSGQLPDAVRVTATPIYGCADDSFSVRQTDDSVILSSAEVPQDGLFLLLRSSDKRSLSLDSPIENDNLLFLEVDTDSGKEIGVVPLSMDAPRDFSVSFSLGSDQQERSSSKFEDPFRVDEIVVVPSSRNDSVTLNWVEKNIGDYDFNGEVNVADLVPLSIHFGESGFRDSAAANTTALYYIDGDENNLINLADIVPIARNYGNSISGYFISKNGSPVLETASQEPAFFSRDPANEWIINDAPVFFQVTVEGSFEDQYAVQPIDNSGKLQSESVVFDGLELQSNLVPHESMQDGGASLFDLSGGGRTVPDSSEEAGSFFAVMRVIWPEDTVDGIGDPPDMLDPLYWNPVPQTYDAGLRDPGGSYRFDKLHRPESSEDHALPYMLEVLVAPTVDLLTGEERSYGGSNVPNNFYYRFNIPVYLPSGHRTMQVDLTMDLVAAADGTGYDVVLYNHHHQSDAVFDDSVVRIALSNDGSAMVSRVFEPEAGRRYLSSDFQFSPQFIDSNADGISDQLQRRLITLCDEEFYNIAPFPVKLTGEAGDYDATLGQFELLNVYKVLSDGLEVFFTGRRMMQFSEMTRLTWIIRDDDGEFEVNVSPELLDGLGDNAEISLDAVIHDGVGLTANGLYPMFWVDDQVITLDLTSAN